MTAFGEAGRAGDRTAGSSRTPEAEWKASSLVVFGIVSGGGGGCIACDVDVLPSFADASCDVGITGVANQSLLNGASPVNGPSFGFLQARTRSELSEAWVIKAEVSFKGTSVGYVLAQ